MIDDSNFSLQRREMVCFQLKKRGIVDKRVLKVMGLFPREEFIPPEIKNQAYVDWSLPIGEGQTISQPYITALMTQLLQLKGKEKVLEIGTGSGYQAAVLAKLVKIVYTLERREKLRQKAEKVFKKLKIRNIKTYLADGRKGWPENSPYEGIIVTAVAKEIPPALIEQLTEGGRLVIPVGGAFKQELIRIIKKSGKLVSENFGGCRFVPLMRGKI